MLFRSLIATARALPAFIESRLQRERAAAEKHAAPPAPGIAELLAELRAVRRRDTLAFGALCLAFAGLWLALSRAGPWPGWALLAAGAGVIACGLRR